MSVYDLARNVTALQTAANVGSPNQIQNLPPAALGAGGPPTEHCFVLTVTGSGAVSATAQIVGSNDGVNFVNYGSAISAGSAPTASSQAQQGSTPFQFLSAIVTAISGTGASATVTVSC